MKSRIIYVLLAVLALSACSDFLDVKPTGKLIPEEPEELANLMNQSNAFDWFYLDNNIGSSLGMRGDNVVMSKNQQTSAKTGNSEPYAAFTFYEPMVDFNTYYYYYWNWNYRAINLFNTIIDGIADLAPASGGNDNGKAIASQARALRAFNYLVGTVLHGPMWDPEGDNSYRVMPYRTTADITAPNPQLSTTEEMFAHIWTDLEAAMDDIPDMVGNPVKPNKAALHAIRAQFFMYKRDWPNMLAEANDAWTAGGGDPSRLLYDFNDFRYDLVGTPPVNGTDHETLSTSVIRYAPNGVVNASEPLNEARGRENLLWRRAVGGTQGNYPSPSFMALFDSGDYDLRHKLFMLTNTGFRYQNSDATDDGLQTVYMRANKLGRSHGITWPEVLLMRAEAYARTGALTEALADLNTLRRNRYAREAGEPITVTDHPDGATLLADQDRLLEEILKERRREMPFYSYHRTVDIKRFFHDTGKPWCQTELVHRIVDKQNGDQVVQEYRVTLDKHSFTLPITNEIIKYNAHWGLPYIDGYWTPGEM